MFNLNNCSNLVLVHVYSCCNLHAMAVFYVLSTVLLLFFVVEQQSRCVHLNQNNAVPNLEDNCLDAELGNLQSGGLVSLHESFNHDVNPCVQACKQWQFLSILFATFIDNTISSR